MTDEVAPREIKVPSVLSDFEVGDRVFFNQSNFSTVFGVVTDVTEDILFVLQSGWPQEKFAISKNGTGTDIRNSSVGQWRKMPDIFQLEVGDVLSTTLPEYLSQPGISREQFVIREISQYWNRMLLRSLVSGNKLALEGEMGLAYLLQHWEVEG